MRVTRTTTPLLSALFLSAALGACKAKDQTSNGTDTTASTAAKIDSAGTPGNPSSTTAANDSAAKANANTGGWTPVSIISFAYVANNGEIAMGKLGEKKATSPAVKAFARQMVADHSAMQAEGKKLGTKLNAMPD